MTTIAADAKKLAKSSAERVRKAKQKADATSRDVFTYRYEDGLDAYALVAVAPDGTVDPLSGALTLDEAKEAASRANDGELPEGVERVDESGGVDPAVAAASEIVHDPSGEQKSGDKPKAAKAKRSSDEPRSRGRKLVHPPTGLIMRMSERAQAECIELTGALPVLNGVAFVRANEEA